MSGKPRSQPATVEPSSQRRPWLSYLSLATAFVFFAWRSWRTWPDILIDFGHELYIPWRLSEGEALYRDIPFSMGPLSQYTNSLLFRLFGASLDTLIAANLSVLMAMTFMVFWLFRRCGTTSSATFITMFFLAVFAFGQYILIGNYNYICPYRHEITHGVALGLVELICLVRFSETRRSFWLIVAGTCVGLVWLTKLEIAIPAISAGLAAVALSSIDPAGDSPASAHLFPGLWNACRLDVRKFAVSAMTLFFGAIYPVLMALIALAFSVGWNHATDAVLGNLRLSTTPSLTINNGFYRSVSGMDAIQANSTRMFAVALFLAVTTAIAISFDRLMGRRIRSRILVTVIGILAGLATAVGVRPDEFLFLPNPLPVLLPCVISFAVVHFWRNPSIASSSRNLAIIAVFALMLLPKIVLNVRWVHYGFALAMPGTLVLVHVFVRVIPEWLNRGSSSPSLFRAIAIGALTGCALVQFLVWNRIDEEKVQPIGDGRDLFYADPNHDDRVLATLKTIEFLRNAMKPGETLCVIPEGSLINYLLRKRNPTGVLIFNPWELDTLGGEGPVRERLVQAAPDYIVQVSMDVKVFGRGDFGNRLYGEQILEFIRSNYHVVEQNFHSVQNGHTPFQATVYKRNGPQG